MLPHDVPWLARLQTETIMDTGTRLQILALCSEQCPVLMFLLVEESSYDRYLREGVGMDITVTQWS